MRWKPWHAAVHADAVRPPTPLPRAVIGTALVGAGTVYLTVGLWSDAFSRMLGADGVPGTLESNLAGRFGALLAFAVEDAAGVLYPFVPLLLLLLTVALARRRSWRHLALRALAAATTLFACATTLAAAAKIAHADPRATGGLPAAVLLRTGTSILGPVGVGLLALLVSLGLLAFQTDWALVGRAWTWLRTRRSAPAEAVSTEAAAGEAAVQALEEAGAGDDTADLTAILPQPALPAYLTPTEADGTAVADTASAEPLEGAGTTAAPEIALSSLAQAVELDTDQPGNAEPEASAADADEDEGPTLPAADEPSEPQGDTTVAPATPAEAQDVPVEPTGVTSGSLLSKMFRSRPRPAAPWKAPTTLFIEPEPRRADSNSELQKFGNQLISVLKQFKVEGTLDGWTEGPSVVCFNVVPPASARVKTYTNLEEDLRIKLKRDSVRVKLLPKAGAIGVEVPHPVRRMVRYRELYQSPAFNPEKLRLPLVLGLDVAGRPVVADLAKMPHLLIAGATGSGKSVAINSFLASLVSTRSPEELRLVLIDPKIVELTPWSRLPHLRHDVITAPEDAVHALSWAATEMDRRYEILREHGVRGVEDYAKNRVEAGGDESGYERLPYIVIVLDEVADIIQTKYGQKIQELISRIAAKSRAAGIHLVVATQRPSVNVITGVVKANLPTRIAFRVTQKVDSRVILDRGGAESLLGYGDMLFIPPGSSDADRVQGTNFEIGEVDALVSWCVSQRPEREWEPDIIEIGRRADPKNAESEDGESESDADWEYDPLHDDALEVVRQFQQGSTSLLQRKLRIGYGRAARLIDTLASEGHLGPANGSRPREFLG